MQQQRLWMFLAVAILAVPAWAASFAPYTQGDNPPYIFDDALAGGADANYPTGETYFVMEYEGVFEIGANVQLTGFGFPIQGATELGTATVTFYGLNGGADASAFEGVGVEPVIGTRTLEFTTDPGSGLFYGEFDTPVSFVAASAGLAISVDHTAYLRLKTRVDTWPDTAFSGDAKRKSDGEAVGMDCLWTLTGVGLPVPSEFQTPYVQGAMPPYLLDDAIVGGSDITYGTGQTDFVMEYESLLQVGSSVEITGFAFPLHGDTAQGQVTVSFYGLNGGADAFAFEGIAVEPLLGTRLVDFTSDPDAGAYYTVFSSPISFVAESTGLAVSVDSTAAMRLKNRIAEAPETSYSGDAKLKADGSPAGVDFLWSIMGTGMVLEPAPMPALDASAANDVGGDNVWDIVQIGNERLLFENEATPTATLACDSRFGAYFEVGAIGRSGAWNHWFGGGAPARDRSASFELWFNPVAFDTSNTASADRVLFEIGGSGRGIICGLDSAGAGNTLVFTVLADDTAELTYPLTTADHWYHVVAIIQNEGRVDDLANDHIELYVDGTQVGTTAASPIEIDRWTGDNPSGVGTIGGNHAPSTIGNNDTTGGSALNNPAFSFGRIAAFRYYGQVLTAAQVATLALGNNDALWTGDGATDDWSDNDNWAGTPAFASAVIGVLFSGNPASSLSNVDAMAQIADMTFCSSARDFVLSGEPISLEGEIRNHSAQMQVIGNDLAVLNGLSVNGGSGVTLNGMVEGEGDVTAYGSVVLNGPLHTTGNLAVMNGELIFANTSGYTGTTRVHPDTGAILRLTAAGTDNPIPNSGYIDIDAGATLDVSGLAGGTFRLVNQQLSADTSSQFVGQIAMGDGSLLEPGWAVAVATFAGGLALEDGSRVVIDFNDPNAADPTEPLDPEAIVNDLVRVNGGTFSLPATGTVSVRPQDPGQPGPVGTYTLFDFTGATPVNLDANRISLDGWPDGTTVAVNGTKIEVTITQEPPTAANLLVSSRGNNTIFRFNLNIRGGWSVDAVGTPNNDGDLTGGASFPSSTVNLPLSRPSGMAINPTNGEVIVIEDSAYGRVLSIDPANPTTATLLAEEQSASQNSIACFHGVPSYVDVDANGIVYMSVDEADGTFPCTGIDPSVEDVVWRIDPSQPASGAATIHVPTTDGANYTLIDPAGVLVVEDKLLVANFGAGIIHRFDLATGAFEADLTDPTLPNTDAGFAEVAGLTWDADNNRMMVTMHNANDVYAITDVTTASNLTLASPEVSVLVDLPYTNPESYPDADFIYGEAYFLNDRQSNPRIILDEATEGFPEAGALLSSPHSILVLSENEPAKYDLDNNGFVNEADWARGFECLAGPSAARPAGCIQSDFERLDSDEDGDVDLKDFAEFFKLFQE